jgi:hypothetical protein
MTRSLEKDFKLMHMEYNLKKCLNFQARFMIEMCLFYMFLKMTVSYVDFTEKMEK